MILGQPLSDSQPIADLRNALLALSSRLPQAYPGPASQEVYGGVNDQMLTALSYLASRLSGIPSSVKTALQGMPVAVAIAQASGSAAVARVMTAIRSAVGAVAAQLTLAVNAYRIALGPGGGGASVTRYPAGSISSFFGGKWHVAIPKGTAMLGESVFTLEGAGDNSPTRTEVRSPTRTEVRSPTRTEVRSPTSTSTEVRSPTSTSTDAYTAGNITVTGGAGSGAYTVVNVYPNTKDFGKSRAGKAAVRELIMMSEAARTGAAPSTVRKTATPGLSGSYAARWHGGGHYPLWKAGLSGMDDFTCETCSTGPLSGPATHDDKGVVPTQPVGPSPVAEPTFKSAVGGQFYKQGWFWGAVAGAVVLSGGTYLVLRRKKVRR